MTRRTTNADPFKVWGSPPEIVLDQLGRKDHDRLRRYVERVVRKVYRIGYDCGAESAQRANGEHEEPSEVTVRRERDEEWR